MQIHPLLNSNDYDLSGGLRNVSQWRALSLYRRSDHKPEAPGTMDRVGYIMVHKTDDVFIPLSTKDCHHNGFAALYDQARNWKINPTDFFPIWNGQNMARSPKEIEEFRSVIPRWRAAGGPDFLLHICMADPKLRDKDVYLMGSDLVGNQVRIIEPGSLAPIGRRIIEGFAKIAGMIARERDNGFIDDRRIDRIFKESRHLLDLLMRMSPTASTILSPRIDPDTHSVTASDEAREALRARMDVAEANADLTNLETLLFGFEAIDGRPVPGIKRALHDDIRNALDPENPNWKTTEMRLLYGNIDLAMAMMNEIDTPELLPTGASLR
jgi:hypothetical protein